MTDTEIQETFEDKNGAVHDAKTGRIIKAAPGMGFDSKRGREMALRRAELLRQRTRKGVEEGVKKAINKRKNGAPVESMRFPEAHQEVVATLMDEVVMNPNEKGKGRADTYRTLLEIEGSLGNIRKPDMGDAPAIQINLNPEAAKALISSYLRIRESKQVGEVIDSTFKVIDE